MTDPKKPGSELARDAQRPEETPRYHGGDWGKADREPPPGMDKVADTGGGTDDAEGKESGGDREGMGGRGNSAAKK